MADLIHCESTLEELNVFFTGLQTRANNAQLQLVVIAKEVCFRDAINRQLTFGNGPDVVRFELATNVALIGRQSGTLMMVASAPNLVWEQTQSFLSGVWTEEQRAECMSGNADWHTFAMYFKNRKASRSYQNKSQADRRSVLYTIRATWPQIHVLLDVDE